MTELNKELRQLRDDVKDANHHKQVLEKQVLKLQEDLEYLTSKYETMRDAEMVRKERNKSSPKLNIYVECSHSFFRSCETRRGKSELLTRRKSKSCESLAWIS